MAGAPNIIFVQSGRRGFCCAVLCLIRVDRIYKEFFGGHRPARSVVQVNDLHFGAKLEVELVAVKAEKSGQTG